MAMIVTIVIMMEGMMTDRISLRISREEIVAGIGRDDDCKWC